MLIDVTVDAKVGKIPFRFLNVWADHAKFLHLVQDVCSFPQRGWKMKSIWTKLKDLKPRLKTLNNEEFKSITLKIEQARSELHHIHKQMASQYSDFLLDQEKTMLTKLEKWSLIDDSVLKQKSTAR